jgi:hypothetical protein
MAYSLRSRLAVVVLLGVTAAAVSACATTINKVLADPSRYRNEEVTVSGTVVDSFSLGTRGAYRLADGTAELWVVSDRGVPRKGARVKATGTIREGFNVGSLGGKVNLPMNLGSGLVLVEREHKAKS